MAELKVEGVALVQLPNIRERLRYNLAPSEAERNAIGDSLAAAQAHLARLQKTGTGTQHHRELHRYVADYSSLLAPIRRLSVEILQTIFLDPDIHNFYAENHQKDPIPSLVHVYNPSLVAMVSHHWQNVARETATLWSSFKVVLWQGRYSLERLRLCLARSKGAPLSITFDWREHDTPLPLHADALQAILAHAERGSMSSCRSTASCSHF
ncbi:hypothetical protein C8R46DRAFT_417467 [Mycena filopes]|nr:hypothetical protein C8R46DRAFT_417467 [Mycena filopes]